MRFKSVKTPLTMVLCLTTLLPLLILGIVVSIQSRLMVETAKSESLALAYADLDHILGGVLGMLNVAGPRGDEKLIRGEIMKIVVGQSGYVYVLDAKGRYVVSKGGTRDGESLWETKDADGRYFIQSIVSKGLALGPGQTAEENYPWQNQGDPKPRVKVARIGYYAPRGWIVGVGSYLDEFMAAPIRIERLAARSDWMIAATGALALVAALAVSLLFGSSLVRSLKRAVGVLESMAEGKLDARFETRSQDEFKHISQALDMVSGAMKRLEDETEGITEAMARGRLRSRCGYGDLKGSYRSLAMGFNRVLDGLVGYLDNMPMPALIIDDQYTIQFMNKAGAGLGNSSGEELSASGRKCHDFFKTGDCRSERCACARAIATGERCDSETTALPLDRPYEIAYTAIPIGDGSGRTIGAFEYIIDQTDMKREARAKNRIADFQDQVISSLNGYLERVARGDLSESFSVPEGDAELGETRRALASMAESLNMTMDAISDILSEVAGAVDQLNSGSDQVAQASQALSQGATEQASSLEETTASVAEIASQTRQNAENASQANALAKAARLSAEQGNARMRDVVEGMADITASAEEIGKIVKSIDDISFQINLLALNANVEAARAGKYGKGFGVVAEEVRNLAGRAAASVQETTEMVQKAIANIERGKALVDATAVQFDSILKGTAEASSLTEEVSAASREQSKGLEQISAGLSQIDQVTQSNTASAEETASAAEEMTGQAGQLKGMVKRFRLRPRKAEVDLSEKRLTALLAEARLSSRANPRQ